MSLLPEGPIASDVNILKRQADYWIAKTQAVGLSTRLKPKSEDRKQVQLHRQEELRAVKPLIIPVKYLYSKQVLLKLEDFQDLYCEFLYVILYSDGIVKRGNTTYNNGPKQKQWGYVSVPWLHSKVDHNLEVLLAERDCTWELPCSTLHPSFKGYPMFVKLNVPILPELMKQAVSKRIDAFSYLYPVRLPHRNNDQEFMCLTTPLEVLRDVAGFYACLSLFSSSNILVKAPATSYSIFSGESTRVFDLSLTGLFDTEKLYNDHYALEVDTLQDLRDKWVEMEIRLFEYRMKASGMRLQRFLPKGVAFKTKAEILQELKGTSLQTYFTFTEPSCLHWLIADFEKMGMGLQQKRGFNYNGASVLPATLMFSVIMDRFEYWINHLLHQWSLHDEVLYPYENPEYVSYDILKGVFLVGKGRAGNDWMATGTYSFAATLLDAPACMRNLMNIWKRPAKSRYLNYKPRWMMFSVLKDVGVTTNDIEEIGQVGLPEVYGKEFKDKWRGIKKEVEWLYKKGKSKAPTSCNAMATNRLCPYPYGDHCRLCAKELNETTADVLIEKRATEVWCPSFYISKKREYKKKKGEIKLEEE